jgi:hypothetical protein
MLTSEKLRKSAADLTNLERNLELQSATIRGGRLALEQLLRDSDADDDARAAAEVEARKAEIADEAAKRAEYWAAVDQAGAAFDNVSTEDLLGLIPTEEEAAAYLAAGRFASSHITDMPAAPASQFIDPGELAVATKD